MSTAAAISQFIENISSNKDKKINVLIFCNLYKAFDLVPHCLLLKNLAVVVLEVRLAAGLNHTLLKDGIDFIPTLENQ